MSPSGMLRSAATNCTKNSAISQRTCSDNAGNQRHADADASRCARAENALVVAQLIGPFENPCPHPLF
jgi:hypothetical protein